jgi:hypothetical protein
MDDIDLDLLRLEARIAEYRATPHTELQMPEYELVEPRVTVTLSHDLLRQIDTLRRQCDGFPSRAAIVREALTIGLPKLLPARIKREARP